MQAEQKRDSWIALGWIRLLVNRGGADTGFLQLVVVIEHGSHAGRNYSLGAVNPGLTDILGGAGSHSGIPLRWGSWPAQLPAACLRQQEQRARKDVCRFVDRCFHG